jgi:acetyl-CoA carboxylase biotin carboxyl carrier protein
MQADEEAKAPSPFDVRTIKDLVALMSRHDLSEIDLREGEVRIRLRRGHIMPIQHPPPGSIVVQATEPATSASKDAPPAPAKPVKELSTIKSPTPGTFYTAPSPEAEAFVQVGSRVTPTTVVCIIEAMKIFNEITADCSGVITEILVENQQPVEFGQVLFKVDPAS